MDIFVEPDEVTPRLERLGLTASGLARVVAAGGGGYSSTTKFHPRSAPGSYLYYETNAALCRMVVPLGWTADEVGGQPRVWDPVRRNCIIVQSGDEMTGIDGPVLPTTKHPHGAATVGKVASNVAQLELFTVDRGVEEDRTVDDGLLTWVLLVAVVDGQVRAELSLPRRMSSSSRPCGWLDRILIPPTDIGTGPRTEVTGDVVETPDTDFDVSWAK